MENENQNKQKITPEQEAVIDKMAQEAVNALNEAVSEDE